jgi:tRNA modification GTPase
MTYDVSDTIAAIASPPGGAARGIVRLGGPHAVGCVEQVFRADGDAALANGRSAACTAGTVNVEVLDHNLQFQLPADLYLWPTHRSYTRQPVAELHTFGSPPLLDALLQAVCRSGARLAAPGEFTLRAFLAGRLDLVQAEAVLGVIHAEMPEQLQTALAQLAGGLSGPLSAIREDLLNVLAELEAGLDFVDEDIEFISRAELERRLAACEHVVAATLEQLTRRDVSPPEYRVVLAGPPNAGKSSLYNALVLRYGNPGTAQALVSSQAGTTRDYLVARLKLGARTYELVDTAGSADCFKSPEPIERASVAAADRQHRRADLLLDCIDASSHAHYRAGPASPCRWPIITKADLVEWQTAEQLALEVQAAAVTSAQCGDGLDALMQRIEDAAGERVEASGAAVAATASRCRNSLTAAARCLAEARNLAAHGCGEELVAAEVRDALYNLGLVVGAVYTDDILDRIFSRFCIGK